jgi:hypothetical protein
MQAHTPPYAAACSLVCTTRRPFPIPSGAQRTRAHFTPPNFLLCHLGLYKFKFKFEFEFVR